MNIPEHILEKASRCKSQTEFRHKYNSSFTLARDNNWLDTLFPKKESTTTIPKVKKQPLDVKQCIELASNYTSKKELRIANPELYSRIHKLKCSKQAFVHLQEYKKYSLEQCQQEANKYTSKSAFKLNSNAIYLYCYRYGILDELCSHMTNPKQIWTLELCHVEALKYSTKKEFMLENKHAYAAAHKHGWINTICSHMKPLGNLHKRCIYAYEFSDNHAYIGLTYNLKERTVNRKLKNNDSVMNYIKKTGLTPVIKQLTEYIDIKEAKILEQTFLEQYINNGWITLNKATTGSLGGNVRVKYTPEQRQIIITLFKTTNLDKIHEYVDFKTSRRTLQQIIKEENLSKCTILSFEDCRDIAGKYQSFKEFRKYDNPAYCKAVREKWLNDICKHLPPEEPVNKRTLEHCKKIALQYQSRKEFRLKEPSLYVFASKNDYLNEICSHMQPTRKTGRPREI